MQIYTDKHKQWLNALMKHFEDKYRNSEIPYNPELVDKYNHPQIKIKGSSNKCSITFKLYENGFVLIQGNSIISWCNSDFLKVLHNINSPCKGVNPSTTPVSAKDSSGVLL